MRTPKAPRSLSTLIVASLLLASSPVRRHRRSRDEVGGFVASTLLVAAQSTVSPPRFSSPPSSPPSSTPSSPPLLSGGHTITVESNFCSCELVAGALCEGGCIPDYRVQLFDALSPSHGVLSEFDCPVRSFECVWPNIPIDNDPYNVRVIDRGVEEGIDEIVIAVFEGVAANAGPVSTSVRSVTPNADPEKMTIEVTAATPTPTSSPSAMPTPAAVVTSSPVAATSSPAAATPAPTEEEYVNHDLEEINFLNLWRFKTDDTTVWVLVSIISTVFFLAALSVFLDRVRYGGSGKTADQEFANVAYVARSVGFSKISTNSLSRHSVAAKGKGTRSGIGVGVAFSEPRNSISIELSEASEDSHGGLTANEAASSGDRSDHESFADNNTRPPGGGSGDGSFSSKSTSSSGGRSEHGSFPTKDSSSPGDGSLGGGTCHGSFVSNGTSSSVGESGRRSFTFNNTSSLSGGSAGSLPPVNGLSSPTSTNMLNQHDADVDSIPRRKSIDVPFPSRRNSLQLVASAAPLPHPTPTNAGDLGGRRPSTSAAFLRAIPEELSNESRLYEYYSSDETNGQYHGRILLTGLALLDFLGDWLFVSERYRLAGYDEGEIAYALAFPPVWPLVFVALPMAINIAIVIRVLVIEFREAAMRDWFHSHSIAGTLIILLGLCHIDALSMLNSRTFGCRRPLSAFHAPLSQRTQQDFFWFGIVGHLLEDVPQIFLQVIVIASERSSLITGIAFVTSLTTFLFGITRRIAYLLLVRAARKDDKQQQERESSLAERSTTEPQKARGLPNGNLSHESTRANSAVVYNNVPPSPSNASLVGPMWPPTPRRVPPSPSHSALMGLMWPPTPRRPQPIPSHFATTSV